MIRHPVLSSKLSNELKRHRKSSDFFLFLVGSISHYTHTHTHTLIRAKITSVVVFTFNLVEATHAKAETRPTTLSNAHRLVIFFFDPFCVRVCIEVYTCVYMYVSVMATIPRDEVSLERIYTVKCQLGVALAQSSSSSSSVREYSWRKHDALFTRLSLSLSHIH